MKESFENLLRLITKLAPPSTLAIAIACSFVILIPQDLAKTLGVDQFRTENRSNISWALIICSAYLIASGIYSFHGVLLNRSKRFFDRRANIRHLRELTNDERKLLQHFMDGENTIHRKTTDGITAGLRDKDIIYSPTSHYDLLQGIPYNIRPWARRYLIKHPQLLIISNESKN